AAAGAGVEAATPAASMVATTVLMGTVWPSLTLISRSTPAEGDGISASTLSVEISKSGSSRSILSPGFFRHLVIVPSKLLSPICAITTSAAIAHLLCDHKFNYNFLREADLESAIKPFLVHALQEIRRYRKTAAEPNTGHIAVPSSSIRSAILLDL